MANYANAKATIAANIYTNHEGQVTAEMVKTAANEIVNTLIAGGYLYAGIAKLTPTQTNPGSPDANVFYIATEPGTYTNFVGAGGSLVVADGEVAIFKYNGTWSKETTGAATAAKVTELGQYVDNILEDLSKILAHTATSNNPSGSNIYYGNMYKDAPDNDTKILGIRVFCNTSGSINIAIADISAGLSNVVWSEPQAFSVVQGWNVLQPDSLFTSKTKVVMIQGNRGMISYGSNNESGNGFYYGNTDLSSNTSFMILYDLLLDDFVRDEELNELSNIVSENIAKTDMLKRSVYSDKTILSQITSPSIANTSNICYGNIYSLLDNEYLVGSISVNCAKAGTLKVSVADITNPGSVQWTQEQVFAVQEGVNRIIPVGISVSANKCVMIETPDTKLIKYGSSSTQEIAGFVYGTYGATSLSSSSQVIMYDITLVVDVVAENSEKIERLESEPKNGYIQLWKDTMYEENTSLWDKNGTWTFNTNGATPSAVGSASSNYLKSKKIHLSDKRLARFNVIMGIDTILNISCSYGSSLNAGEGASDFAIDFANKKLIIYQAVITYAQDGGIDQTVGYTNTILASTDIPDAAIGARKYVVELHKDGLAHRLVLLDELTGTHVLVESDGWAAGRQNQYYGLYCAAGTMPTISNFEVLAWYRPDVMFIGDSITEGVSVTNKAKRYAELFRTNNPDKRVVITARGSMTISDFYAVFASEVNKCRPRIISVLLGTNDIIQGATTEQLTARYTSLLALCDALDAKVVLNYIPCLRSANLHLTVNPVIALFAKSSARFDKATAIDNVPDNGYNPELYGDSSGTHPNNDGDEKMYERLLIDCPDLFYN